MRFFKDSNNELFAYSDEDIKSMEKSNNTKIKKLYKAFLNLEEITMEERDAALEQIKLDNNYYLIEEQSQLLGYLSSTDYMVTKCLERKLDMETEYPEAYIKRQEARERIDKIKIILGDD